ncbi:SepM family pheromone-processing serine protease [Paenibacillus xylaniclasticus]|uniref:SepM family pheromone-processing serine protease n=1 Tax=Paenibacillus xylaniclasticus TaxID=588083 RepID=UPI000FDB54F9|nr:SepM family pheromone-processing serine protease [Paenibacillus xylaniclasticus]
MKWLKHTVTRWLAALAACFVILFLIPTPYYLYQPGTVERLSSLITVDQGNKDSGGSFNLTTVLSIRATNAATLIYGILQQDTEVRKASDVKGNLTDAEYVRVLNHMMSASQRTAIASALTQSGHKVDAEVIGLFVTVIQPGSKANGVLQIGDIITSVDDEPATSVDRVSKYLSANKKAGDTVQLSVKRGGTLLTEQVQLVPLSADSRPVLGLTLEPEYAITPERQVIFTASEIGGPSAGLMFALEIMDQLMSEDLTHGMKIAGTGTIDLEGNVGQIGGIRDKIVAAHLAGVELFFCPKDPEGTKGNEQDAIDEAKKRGYDLRIVPVSTLAEAIEYLNQLP